MSVCRSLGRATQELVGIATIARKNPSGGFKLLILAVAFIHAAILGYVLQALSRRREAR